MAIRLMKRFFILETNALRQNLAQTYFSGSQSDSHRRASYFRRCVMNREDLDFETAMAGGEIIYNDEKQRLEQIEQSYYLSAFTLIVSICVCFAIIIFCLIGGA